MGLPRALADRANSLFPKWGRENLWDLIATSVACVAEDPERVKVFQELETHEECVHQMRCWMQHRFRSNFLMSHASSALDEMEKVDTTRYVGIDEDGRTVTEPVRVSRFFLPTLRTLNAVREQQDRGAIAWRDYVQRAQVKVYTSRQFPDKLRALIFMHDDYTCRHCGKHEVELRAAGSWLECDHIVAWEDGGLTCYENGQTLCRECNGAKHRAKREQAKETARLSRSGRGSR